MESRAAVFDGQSLSWEFAGNSAPFTMLRRCNEKVW